MDRQVRDWSGMWLWLLPVYALLTFVATLTHQPDPNRNLARGASTSQPPASS